VSAPRVVYVLSKFPCYDEAFLLREVHAVAQRLDTWIFSLRAADESVVHEEALRLLPRTLSVPYLFSLRILRAHLALFWRSPRRYLTALTGLIAGSSSSLESRAKNLVLFPKMGWLAHWVLANGATHLHAGWATYPASAALVVSEIAGIPWSFSGHAHDIYLDASELPRKLRLAAFVSTCTGSNASYLRALVPECPPDRVTVVHHGIRSSDYTPARDGVASGDEVGARAGSLNVLSVGTLNPHKGFTYLIEALAQLVREGRELQATIVGGGPLEQDLRAQLVRAGLGARVTMTGALTQAAVIPQYKRSSIFVLMAQPEWHWGIPNVIIEALAAGNAVITTRFGSVEELVKDGETGLLVPPKDAAALAAAIRRLADDPGLGQRLGEAGRAIVARDFDLDRTALWYVDRFSGVAR
jgi:glycosyltransferase involved in cell wall biosynthesis